MPNKLLSPIEFEQLRKERCRSLSIRYTKLPKRQLLAEVIRHNNQVKGTK